MPQDMMEQDALRPCPICRTPISVLAVRCRHCGAEVGRPRKETETFTIRDLGGESETTYTVSGNVLDALEIFRAEELSAQRQQRRTREVNRGLVVVNRQRNAKTTSSRAICRNWMPSTWTWRCWARNRNPPAGQSPHPRRGWNMSDVVS